MELSNQSSVFSKKDDTLLRPLMQAAIYDNDGAGEVTMLTISTKYAKDFCSMFNMYTDKASSELP